MDPGIIDDVCVVVEVEGTVEGVGIDDDPQEEDDT
jgi:hypothetical protein